MRPIITGLERFVARQLGARGEIIAGGHVDYGSRTGVMLLLASIGLYDFGILLALCGMGLVLPHGHHGRARPWPARTHFTMVVGWLLMGGGAILSGLVVISSFSL